MPGAKPVIPPPPPRCVDLGSVRGGGAKKVMVLLAMQAESLKFKATSGVGRGEGGVGGNGGWAPYNCFFKACTCLRELILSGSDGTRVKV